MATNINFKDVLNDVVKATNEPVKNKPVKQPKPTAPPQDDSITLSKEAQQLSKLETKIRDSSEIDEAKVAKIKQELEDGTYKINPDKIANKLIDMDVDLFNHQL